MKDYEDEAFDDIERAQQRKVATGMTDGSGWRKRQIAEQGEPPPECQTEAEKTAFAFGWWKALESQRQEQGEPVACERCKQLEEQAYDLLGQLKVANIKLAYTTPQQPVIDKSAAIRIATALGWTPPKQEQGEPVVFKIYKPTPPRHAIPNVRDAELPWVYDQDPSSGNVASMWVTPVKTTLQQRKPLTDDEMWALWNSQGSDEMNQQEAIAFARAIEAAHGIKENT
jgi:hypothetical protein